MTLAVLGGLFVAADARAADQFCFCATDVSKLDQIDDPGSDQKVAAWCSGAAIASSACNSDAVRQSQLPQGQFLTCQGADTVKACQSLLTQWKDQRDKARKTLSGTQTVGGSGSGLIFRAIPSCVFQDKLDLSGECGSVNVFITLLINLANALFGIIGAVALAAFIYGGFLFILSSGNSEKITQGKDAMLAAFIGLAIAFGGYFLVRFLGEALGLKEGFNLK